MLLISSLHNSIFTRIRKHRVRHLTFFFQLALILWMVTLSSCRIWQIICFILPLNEYGCVYAWTTLGNIAWDRLTEDADFGKKNHLFRWSWFWSWRDATKIVAFGVQKTRTNSLKSWRTQNDSLFGANFGPEA